MLVVKKCCAPSDRINSLSNSCESNKNGVPLNEIKIKSEYQFEYSFCEKISRSFKGSDYEIDTNGISIFPESGSVEFFRDYCLDTDL
jgi:hypothetical protein